MLLGNHRAPSPAVVRLAPAAVETAGFAVHAARTAATAVCLIQHGQVGGGGMGGGALCGGATGLTHHGNSRLAEQQLSKVRLLQHLFTVVHHTAGVQREKKEHKSEKEHKEEGRE